MNLINVIRSKFRLTIQIIFTALTNGYLLGYMSGKIYKGDIKNICAPGLNCYSCPGAIASCPIGSIQAIIGNRDFKFSFYLIGFLMIIGSTLGRFVCGWLCPFGLVQDLLYKIPYVKKIKKVPIDKALRGIKYIILIIFVVIFPIVLVNYSGYGKPWFCKLICPSGTLMAGIPLILMNSSLSNSIGFLFVWKLLILIVIVVLSTMIYRPFCKYICPLGAIYGFLNKYSIYKYEINNNKCTKCNLCYKNCDMNIAVNKTPNSIECIRCGKCIEVCPKNAISVSVHKCINLNKKFKY
ncbi:iron-sulfur binding protein [[Clostridium] sordellii]|uniref:4Fe-4S binding protein n=1 Tax=Paraclostridium sordellii TaxID=1505 RepID=UPI0005E2C3AC|nr:iron-sulfur binding protein [[Clostridium] sordellii] [Paeniclostridium sordellii]